MKIQDSDSKIRTLRNYIQRKQTPTMAINADTLPWLATVYDEDSFTLSTYVDNYQGRMKNKEMTMAYWIPMVFQWRGRLGLNANERRHQKSMTVKFIHRMHDDMTYISVNEGWILFTSTLKADRYVHTIWCPSFWVLCTNTDERVAMKIFSCLKDIKCIWNTEAWLMFCKVACKFNFAAIEYFHETYRPRPIYWFEDKTLEEIKELAYTAPTPPLTDVCKQEWAYWKNLPARHMTDYMTKVMKDAYTIDLTTSDDDVEEVPAPANVANVANATTNQAQAVPMVWAYGLGL